VENGSGVKREYTEGANEGEEKKEESRKMEKEKAVAGVTFIGRY